MELDAQKYYEGLNPQQRKAVFNDEKYLCLLAIPGSGKTFSLIGKIIHLIDSEMVYPNEITAITFTNKAAKELKERVNKYIGEADGELITIGTFHSLCVRILIRYGYALGLEKFSILDDKTSSKKLKKLAENYLSKDDYDVKVIKRKISKWKTGLISPKKAFGLATKSFDKIVAKIYNDYYQECRMENNLDFDDLIVKTVLLLKIDSDIRNKVTKEIKFLLVDESQDTNDIQFKLIKLLLRKETMLFMVADDDQSIYGFRGAEPKYILNFKKIFKSGITLKLEQNYRSTQNIVNASNYVISNNNNRQQKNSFTENEIGEKIVIHETEDAYDEARYVTREVKNLVEMNGYNYRDIAILYRINSQSAKLEKELNKERIPYHIIGSTSFYERAEVKDIMAYFKLLVNKKDKESFERILGLQSGIGKKAVERIFEFQNEKDIDCVNTIELYNDKPAIINKIKPLKSLFSKTKDIEDPEEILNLILIEMQYINYLSRKYESDFQNRKENVSEMFAIAKNYNETNSAEFKSLQDFVSQLSLSSSEIEEPDTLKMLTIHSAKGLEFPIVFIIGVEENLMPYALAMNDEKQIEEERRLFYVGMTRAEKKLYLSHSLIQYTFKGQRKDAVPSRFLSNIPHKYTKELEINNGIEDFDFEENDNMEFAL
ncbi:MAG: hypothetical protein B6I28_03690 [Fusobacteriia bacterium 4572_132]|nr:MAG: hypothetical protein B6I28_03690 [Fusobacteriia bacterium 4572_132]